MAFWDMFRDKNLDAMETLYENQRDLLGVIKKIQTNQTEMMECIQLMAQTLHQAATDNAKAADLIRQLSLRVVAAEQRIQPVDEEDSAGC